ncbi:cytochrome P450 [Apiospora saccharicola]|uniref:Cytochrome P450 n=1 Tax=Apiospora saccharicola TaxID=335842 RepID=A0ABR1WD73_9PEZI
MEDYYYKSQGYASHSVLKTMVWGGAGAIVAYGLGLAVYRLCLSPIAGFPGPKLAALSLWYEFYYDVVCGGRCWAKINELHDRYGPVIRINPYELHVRDPDFYDTLYAGPSSGPAPRQMGLVPRRASAPSRTTRTACAGGALNPFFTKQAIAHHVEPVIRQLLAQMCARFESMKQGMGGGSGEVLDVMRPYAALTTDVITRYAFDTSYGCVEDPGWRFEWPRAMVEGTKSCHANKQFPWVVPLLRAVPEGVVGVVSPAVLQLINFQKDLARQISAIMNEPRTDSKETDSSSERRPTTIFHELIDSDALPPEEKTLQRLVDEGQTLIAAGQETTSFLLQTVTYHVLASPALYARLRAELQNIDVMNASVAQLERLPYLRAVVQEGHRFAHGVVGRLQRISPDAPLHFHPISKNNDGGKGGGRDWAISPGTPVSMTSILQHRDPVKFPNPDTFDPGRWLATPEAVVALDKYLVPFSKGTRSCLGMNLATAEIYLTLAAVFGNDRFEMGLYETSARDAEVVHDYFIPHGHADSKGVRVVFK